MTIEGPGSALESGPNAAPPRLGLASATWSILRKDLTIEARTREVVTTAGYFAALVAILSSFAFHAGADTTVRVAPGAIWIAITFAGVLAIGRSWLRERDEWALGRMLLSPVSRVAIFLGKGLGLLLFLFVIELVTVPIVAVLFAVDLIAIAPPLLAFLLLGNLGIASFGTLFGAMTARTRARELVLSTVLFPLLAPLLVAAVAGTRLVVAGAGAGNPATFAELSDYYLLMLVFDVLGLTGGAALFGALIED